MGYALHQIVKIGLSAPELLVVIVTLPVEVFVSVVVESVVVPAVVGSFGS